MKSVYLMFLFCQTAQTMAHQEPPIRQPCNPDVVALKDHAPGDVINHITLATDGRLIKTAL